MPNCSEKLTVGIYKISDSVSFDDLVSKIEDKHYIKQDVKIESVDGFSVFLYYMSKPSFSKWKPFISNIAKDDQPILHNTGGMVEGFILLLKDTVATYAATGGSGYFAIQDCLDDDFGMDVFSRIIKKDDKVIRAVREMSFVGGVLGESRHFRNSYNLYENNRFGKIYQELKANLNQALLTEKLGFTEDEIKKNTVCIAKSSFTISKAITFDQLLKVIKGCEDILMHESAIPINNVVKLDKKKDKNLIQLLDKKLLGQLWERFTNTRSRFMFDLCHGDFEKYLTASRYEVRKNQSTRDLLNDGSLILNDIDILFQRLKELNVVDTSAANAEDQFHIYINSLRVNSYDEDGKELTQGRLLEHIFGDVGHDDNLHYFFIDNSWYRIKDDFIRLLNDECDYFTKNNWCDTLISRQWDFNNSNLENDFNRLFIGEQNTIVLDKIVPENIEPCDILKWDDDNLYFIHVKAHFGNTMRDLCSQIMIAAQRIKQDLLAGKLYIDKIYTTLQNKIGGDDYFDLAGRQTEVYTRETFQSLFNKKCVFILAVLDKSNRDLKTADRFNSNIAKFSLQDLVKTMKGMDVELRISQIMNHEAAN